MNEQLQPCRCGEIEEIHFLTLHYTRRNYHVGLVECNSCGMAVGFVSMCMDHAEFRADAIAAWNSRKELDQLRQRLACTLGVGDGSGQLFVHGDYNSIKAAQAIIDGRDELRAKLALAEQDARRLEVTGVEWKLPNAPVRIGELVGLLVRDHATAPHKGGD